MPDKSEDKSAVAENKAAAELLGRDELLAELERYKELAGEAVKAKSDFLARMSHEIRTPLNAIIGLANLALNTDLSAKQLDYLSKIRSSSYSLLGIVNDISDFSEIEQGKLKLVKTNFNLRDVVDRVAEYVSGEAMEKGLELIISIDPDTPRHLSGDYLRLEQVLVNLANNAVKFTDSGEVEVKITPLEVREDAASLEFSVRDTGIGMDLENAGDLFEPFTQADGSITRKYGGSGLGLSICKRIGDKMGARLEVKSEPGKGSTFVFTVDFEINDNESDWDAVLDLSGKRVLAVDDNETALHLVGEYLKGFSMDAVLATSGAQAMEEALKAKAQGRPFDIILLDWLMPELNGLDTFRALKGNPELGECPPVVMISAHSRREVVAQAEKEGVGAFLFKPLTRSLLLNTITDLFAGVRCAYSGGLPDSAPESIEQSLIRGMRVLLVEDNVINQQVAKEILSSWGVEVSIADNGLDAVQALEEREFDLVLMDLQMPGMDGFEATKNIRSKGYKLPVIALTAHTTDQDRNRSFEAGMDDFVTKPIDPDLLYRAMVARSTPVLNQGGGIQVVSNHPVDALGRPGQPGETGETVIDIESGLRRMAGNKKLFMTLARDFADDYKDSADVIGTALADGDIELARRTAHTVKGVSGNISAKILFESAKNLEKAITDDDRGAIPGLLEVFSADLGRAVDAADGMAGSEAPGPEAEIPSGGSPEPVAEDESEDRDPEQADVEDEPAEVPKLKILLADDAKTVRRMFTSLLMDMGHEVVTVENGRDAFRTLYRQWKDDRKFDLLIMDLEMPVLGGLEAAKKIREYRSSSFDSDIPIIVISAHTDKDKLLEAMDVGVNLCIDKSVGAVDLKKVIAGLWNNRTAGETGPEHGEEPGAGTEISPEQPGTDKTLDQASDLAAQGGPGAAGNGSDFEEEPDAGTADEQMPGADSGQESAGSVSDQQVEPDADNGTGPGQPDCDLEKVKPVLSELRLLIRRSSIKAEAGLETLAGLLAGDSLKLVREIQTDLAGFDFSAAGEHIEKLAMDLGLDK